MSGVVVDTSVWIDFFAGERITVLEEALAQGAVVLTPIVVAELVSGTARERDRREISKLVTELPLHETPLAHWVGVGELRRKARAKGLAVSTPDAHVARCALEREALLLSRDAVFPRIARIVPLHVRAG